MSLGWLFFQLRARRYRSALMMLVFLPGILLWVMVHSYIEATIETAQTIAHKGGPAAMAESAALAEQTVRANLPLGLGLVAVLLVLGHLVFRLLETPCKLTSESERFLCNLPLTRRQLSLCGLIDNLTAFNTILPAALALVPAYLAFLNAGLSGLLLFALPAYLAAESLVWAVSAVLHRGHWLPRQALAVALAFLASLILLSLFTGLGKGHGAGDLLRQGALWLGQTLAGRNPELLRPWSIWMYSVALLSLLTAVLVHRPRELGWASAPATREGLPALRDWADERLVRPVRSALRTPLLAMLGLFLFILALLFEIYWARSELAMREKTLLSPTVIVAALVCMVISRGAFGHFAFLRNLPIPTFRIVLDSLLPGIRLLAVAFLFKAVVFLGCALLYRYPILPAIGHCLYLLFWIAPFALLCASVGLLANLLCEKSWQNRRWQSGLLVVTMIFLQESFFVTANLCFAFWLNELSLPGLGALYVVAPLYFFFATVLFDRIDMLRFSRRPVLEARG